MANSYEEAIKEAKEALEDIKKRGEAAKGDKWEDVRKELFTPEEIAMSDLRVAIIGAMIKARQAGMTFDEVEEITKEAFYSDIETVKENELATA